MARLLRLTFHVMYDLKLDLKVLLVEKKAHDRKYWLLNFFKCWEFFQLCPWEESVLTVQSLIVCIWMAINILLMLSIYLFWSTYHRHQTFDRIEVSILYQYLTISPRFKPLTASSYTEKAPGLLFRCIMTVSPYLQSGTVGRSSVDARSLLTVRKYKER